MAADRNADVAALLEMPKFGDGIGFRRMQHLLRPLMESDWGQGFTTIRIAGSNGKGSVAAIVHSLLRCLGVECGRHTSPHLARFNERFVVGGSEVGDGALSAAFAWLWEARAATASALAGDAFGSFELITALCAKLFHDAGVPVGVMEAGIGGRYDPARLFPGSLVALTSVDLEHADLLGGTLELIACDKADLCPDGGTLVGFPRDADLWGRIEAYCRLRRVRLVDASAMHEVERISAARPASPGGMAVRVRGERIDSQAQVPLLGTFQLDNIAVACSLADLWAREFLPSLGPEAFAAAVVRGLATVEWPGRFERISADPPAYIDVGHTPDACSRLAQSVREFLPNEKILLVAGVSANKAVDAILAALVPVADAIICTRAYHKGADAALVAQAVRRLAPAKEAWESPAIEEAASRARLLATARGMTVLAAGGLFLAAEFRAAWEGSDPRRLLFY